MSDKREVKRSPGGLDRILAIVGAFVTTIGAVSGVIVSVSKLHEYSLHRRLFWVLALVTSACAFAVWVVTWLRRQPGPQPETPGKTASGPRNCIRGIRYRSLPLGGILLTAISVISWLALLFPEPLERAWLHYAHTSVPTILVSDVSSERQPEIAAELFTQVLAQSRELEQAIGHLKLPQPIWVWGAYQAFDNGLMVWRADSLDIYVLHYQGVADLAQGTWREYRDTWTGEMDKVSCPEANTPSGPVQGFGKVWCENQQVREELGSATMTEVNCDLVLQSFDRGWLILAGDTVYVLMVEAPGDDSGNWKSVEQHVPIYHMISLEGLPQSKRSSEETNLGHSPVVSDTTSSIPFDTRWGVSTQCSHCPACSTRLSLLKESISNPASVHLLLNAGWGLKRYEGQQVGKILLDFSDGSTHDAPVVLGFNIRDWQSDSREAVTTVTSSDLQLAWKGTAPDGKAGQVDVLTIEIPSRHSRSVLESIQVLDVSSTVDPCIQLLAVTVKSNWP